LAKFGALNGLIQCAGVGNPKRVISSRGKVHDLKTFKFVVDVNLLGTFNVLRLASAVMAKQPQVDNERGIIINVASVAAFDGQIGQAAYSASKGAIVAMTLPLARDLAQHKIRVNTIAPGIFETPMMAKLPQKVRVSLAQQVPFPARLGRPAEFAHLCASLIENQYMNAGVIRLDGSIRMAAM
jgi:NAD(P)-dependent dehydrogenase (short-subunit alcohol dehydrogenase family)